MSDESDRPIVTILVGLDGSPESASALRFAAGLAGQLGAEVVAAHAVGLLDVWPDQSHATGERNSHTRVAELMNGAWTSPLEQPGILYRVVLRDGPASHVLLDIADDVDADVIVVGTRGAGQADLYALGDTSTKITHHSLRPVVVVPGPRARVRAPQGADMNDHSTPPHGDRAHAGGGASDRGVESNGAVPPEHERRG